MKCLNNIGAWCLEKKAAWSELRDKEEWCTFQTSFSCFCFFLLPLIIKFYFSFSFGKGKWWKMWVAGYVLYPTKSSRYVPHTKQVKLPHLICYAKNLSFFIHKNLTVHWTFSFYHCCKCIPLTSFIYITLYKGSKLLR